MTEPKAYRFTHNFDTKNVIVELRNEDLDIVHGPTIEVTDRNMITVWSSTGLAGVDVIVVIDGSRRLGAERRAFWGPFH